MGSATASGLFVVIIILPCTRPNYLHHQTAQAQHSAMLPVKPKMLAAPACEIAAAEQATWSRMSASSPVLQPLYY